MLISTFLHLNGWVQHTSLKIQTPDKNYMNDKNDEGKVCVYTITLTEVMK